MIDAFLLDSLRENLSGVSAAGVCHSAESRFSVLLVCTANHCRSPLLEFLFRSRVDACGLPWDLRSAGVHATPGQPPHPQVAKLVRDLDVDTESWRSSQVTPAMIERADVVLTAADEHRAAVLRLMPSAVNRTFTFLQFVHLAKAGTPDFDDRIEHWGPELVRSSIRGRSRVQPLPAGARSLPDPMGRRKGAFRRCADMIELSLDSLLPVIPDVGRHGPVSTEPCTRPVG